MSEVSEGDAGMAGGWQQEEGNFFYERQLLIFTTSSNYSFAIPKCRKNIDQKSTRSIASDSLIVIPPI